eukprot:5772536-Pyramimonas_sp.AAC.1
MLPLRPQGVMRLTGLTGLMGFVVVMGLFVHIGHEAHNAEWLLQRGSLESSALGGHWAHRARNAPGGHRASSANRTRRP